MVAPPCRHPADEDEGTPCITVDEVPQPRPITQARLDGETTFEGAALRGELIEGTTVQVLVGHLDEMERRGYEGHTRALLGN